MSVDLASMLPKYFQDVMEFQEIMSAENASLEILERSIGRVWDNNYIQTCDENTVSLYEQLLNVVPRTGESLEYRKKVILNRLSQRLPYSLPRLKELLDAAVGRNGYELLVRHQEYKLELNIIDQTYLVLLDVKSTVQEMIPAHLLFIFAGRFSAAVPVDIHYTGRLELQSEYHARYNRKFLILDGTWTMDGTYKLNGYKELTDIDLYPLALTVRGGYNTAPDTSAAVSCRSGTEVAAGTESAVEISGSVFSLTATESRSRTGSKVTAGPGADLVLTVEKDLWYLDGNYLLDGTKLLDAEIIRYE